MNVRIVIEPQAAPSDQKRAVLNRLERCPVLAEQSDADNNAPDRDVCSGWPLSQQFLRTLPINFRRWPRRATFLREIPVNVPKKTAAMNSFLADRVWRALFGSFGEALRHRLLFCPGVHTRPVRVSSPVCSISFSRARTAREVYGSPLAFSVPTELPVGYPSRDHLLVEDTFRRPKIGKFEDRVFTTNVPDRSVVQKTFRHAFSISRRNHFVIAHTSTARSSPRSYRTVLAHVFIYECTQEIRYRRLRRYICIYEW